MDMRIEGLAACLLISCMVAGNHKASHHPTNHPARHSQRVRLFAHDSIVIGKQVWMKSNLMVDRFRNGDPIPEARTEAEWKQAVQSGQPAWCHYDNNPDFDDVYGKLYNWHAVNDIRGLAPKGWHVPSDAEWTLLTETLGGSAKAGDMLKSGFGWKECRGKSGNGSDESGFGAPAGGCRTESGAFDLVGETGFWWSSSLYESGIAWARNLNCEGPDVDRATGSVGFGYSVRCVRN